MNVTENLQIALAFEGLIMNSLIRKQGKENQKQ